MGQKKSAKKNTGAQDSDTDWKAAFEANPALQTWPLLEKSGGSH
jgi:hypothetical protein